MPTASASTTVCGKFSQLDERIDDPAPGLRAEERHTTVDAELVRAALERLAVGAFSGDDETHSVGGCDCAERTPE